MQERKLILADGTGAVINDHEWTNVVNVKRFDDNFTDIIRVTRNTRNGNIRIYVMHAVSGEVRHEQNHILAEGVDFVPLMRASAVACEIGEETVQEALGQLQGPK